jgi:hypothetical protein
MNEGRITESPLRINPQGQVMKTPDDVAEMLRLKACGWGVKRIARHLGCSHHTAKDYVAAGRTRPYRAPRHLRCSTVMNSGCTSGSCATAALRA